MRNVPITAALILVLFSQATAFAQCAPAPDSPYFFRNLAEKRIADEIAAKPAVVGKRFFSISNYTLLEHRKGYTVASYLLIEGVNNDGQAQVSETQMREVYEVVDGQWRLASAQAVVPESAKPAS